MALTSVPAQDTTGRGGHRGCPFPLPQSLEKVTSDSDARVLIFSRDEQEIREALLGDGPGESLVAQYRISPEDVKPDATIFSRSIVDKRLINKNRSGT